MRKVRIIDLLLVLGQDINVKLNAFVARLTATLLAELLGAVLTGNALVPEADLRFTLGGQVCRDQRGFGACK